MRHLTDKEYSILEKNGMQKVETLNNINGRKPTKEEKEAIDSIRIAYTHSKFRVDVLVPIMVIFSFLFSFAVLIGILSILECIIKSEFDTLVGTIFMTVFIGALNAMPTYIVCDFFFEKTTKLFRESLREGTYEVFDSINPIGVRIGHVVNAPDIKYLAFELNGKIYGNARLADTYVRNKELVGKAYLLKFHIVKQISKKDDYAYMVCFIPDNMLKS